MYFFQEQLPLNMALFLALQIWLLFLGLQFLVDSDLESAQNFWLILEPSFKQFVELHSDFWITFKIRRLSWAFAIFSGKNILMILF